MIIAQTVQECRNHLNARKNIGFVPTMGALHEGHLSLIQQAKAQCEYVVVSIYLNQTQFNDPNDLKTYPSDLQSDLSMLRDVGVDLVFTPNYTIMYPDQYTYQVRENQNSSDLCGADRPGHFDGVLTVVMKLLNIVHPQKAFFGEKDFQQLQLIRGMVDSFFLDIEIIGCPIVRDNEGLALSSRNKKLDSEGLKKARFFARQLQEKHSIEKTKAIWEEQGIEVDYLKDKDQRRYAAVRINQVRLIDNVPI